MKDNEGLVNALHSNPRDDTLRLVYADWLEERGENDRAGYLRLQVELAKRLPKPV
jgi:uncharacterized protein (TIGR02996 family)